MPPIKVTTSGSVFDVSDIMIVVNVLKSVPDDAGKTVIVPAICVITPEFVTLYRLVVLVVPKTQIAFPVIATVFPRFKFEFVTPLSSTAIPEPDAFCVYPLIAIEIEYGIVTCAIVVRKKFPATNPIENE